MVLVPRHLEEFAQPEIQGDKAWNSEDIAIATFASARTPKALVGSNRIGKKIRCSLPTSRGRGLERSGSDWLASHLPVGGPSGRVEEGQVDGQSGMPSVDATELPSSKDCINYT